MKEIDDLRFLIASGKGLDMISPVAADLLQEKIDALENAVNIKIAEALGHTSNASNRIELETPRAKEH